MILILIQAKTYLR